MTIFDLMSNLFESCREEISIDLLLDVDPIYYILSRTTAFRHQQSMRTLRGSQSIWKWEKSNRWAVNTENLRNYGIKNWQRNWVKYYPQIKLLYQVFSKSINLVNLHKHYYSLEQINKFWLSMSQCAENSFNLKWEKIIVSITHLNLKQSTTKQDFSQMPRNNHWSTDCKTQTSSRLTRHLFIIIKIFVIFCLLSLKYLYCTDEREWSKQV